MIVDCHTHVWTSPDQLGKDGRAVLLRRVGRENLAADPLDHASAAKCVDKSLVFGLCSDHLGSMVTNEFVAEYVSSARDKLIGVAAIDPTRPDALASAAKALEQPAFRCLAVSPSSQNFHPADTRAMRLYEFASRRSVPVFFDQGGMMHPKCAMEFARPSLLDEIAREFPDLMIVVCGMGGPWAQECVALIGKHPCVFAEVSGLVTRPWHAYNALVLAHQSNTMDKLLFASGFPYMTPAAAIETLYRMHEMTAGTNLPSIPREALRSVIERDALGALRIARLGETPLARQDDDEELRSI